MEEEVKGVVGEEEVAKTARELYVEKANEMKEKYADVMNDLLVKYGGTVDRGFEYLKAIPRAIVLGEEPLYATEVELNMDELVADYKELLRLSNEVANG